MIWLTETSRIESSEICIAISSARLMAAWYRSASAARFCSASRPPAATIVPRWPRRKRKSRGSCAPRRYRPTVDRRRLPRLPAAVPSETSASRKSSRCRKHIPTPSRTARTHLTPPPRCGRTRWPAARTARDRSPPGRAVSAAWVPCSTISPRSNTRIRSRLRTVDSRCAITIEVRPFISRSIACWIRPSDSESRLEVASSRISTGASARNARASATRCRSPPDSLTPRSPTSVP